MLKEHTNNNMIKKITITAVAIRKTKKDGTPYTYAEKNKTTRVPTGKQLPRTLVSIKDDQENWYMGWSYKDGSPAETVQKGQTLELFITEDGDFKNWRFIKDEDKKDAELAELKAKLAEFEGKEAPAPAKESKKKKDTGEVSEEDLKKIPF